MKFFFLLFSACHIFVLSAPSIFYVSPDATSCDLSSKDICRSENSACPIFCPFYLQEFRTSENVTIKLKNGIYDLSSMKPSYVKIQNLTRSGQSISIEINMFNISTDHQYVLFEPLNGLTQKNINIEPEITITNFPMSEYYHLLEHHKKVRHAEFYLFYIMANSVTIGMRGMSIQSPLPKEPKPLEANCISRTIFEFCRPHTTQHSKNDAEESGKKDINYFGLSSCDHEPRVILKHMRFENMSMIANGISEFISEDSDFRKVGGVLKMTNELRIGSPSYLMILKKSTFHDIDPATTCAAGRLVTFEIAIQGNVLEGQNTDVKIAISDTIVSRFAEIGSYSLVFSVGVWDADLDFSISKSKFWETQRNFFFSFYSTATKGSNHCCRISMDEILVEDSNSGMFIGKFFKSHANLTDAYLHHKTDLCLAVEITNSQFLNNERDWKSSYSPSYFYLSAIILEVHEGNGQILDQEQPILMIRNTTFENGKWDDNAFFSLEFDRLEYSYRTPGYGVELFDPSGSDFSGWACDSFEGKMAFVEISDSNFISLFGETILRIHSTTSYVNITGTKFRNGTHEALDISGSIGVIITDCEFEYFKKGAVQLALEGETQNQCYKMKDCLFSNNEGENGGAVQVSFGAPDLVFYFNNGFSNCVFRSNSATGSGGAIWVTMTNPLEKEGLRVFVLQNCSFLDNSALFGGAVFLDEMSMCIMADGDRNTSVFENNIARGSGGAVFANRKGGFVADSWICNDNSVTGYRNYYPTFFKNYLVDSKGGLHENSVLGRVEHIITDPVVENECREFIGQNNFWKCETRGVYVTDFADTPFFSPTYQDIVLKVRVEGIEGQENNVLLRARPVTAPGICMPFYFFAEYGDFENNEVRIEVEMLGETKTTMFTLIRNKGFISTTWFYVVILFSLFTLCCCLFFCICCVALFLVGQVFGVSYCCMYSNVKKHEFIRIAELEFYQYDLKSAITRPRSENTGWSVDFSDEDFSEMNEKTNLLYPQIAKMESRHVFYGDFNGYGTVFFKSGRKKFHPVFSGIFRDRKRSGEGVEFYFDQQEFITSVTPDWWSSEHARGGTFSVPSEFQGVRKFVGSYENDERNGFGTEFSKEDTKNNVVGDWSKGTLTKIFSIEYPLELFDLSSDFEIKDRKGGGGYGSVFMALYKKRNDMKVALKVFGKIKPHQAPGSFDSSLNSGGFFNFKQVRRIESYKECVKIGNILKRICMINHPNIVSIIGWSGPTFVKTEFAYAMELCECSVQDYYQLKQGEISRKIKDKILVDCALGMEAFHDQCGFIHRDLKLSNLLIDRVDEVSMSIKICDFNLGLQDFEKKIRRETAAGSPFNCAPESYSGEFDNACDVYSFAIMMYELYFDRVGDPFNLREDNTSQCVCPECGDRLNTREMVEEMTLHHQKHGENFRPRIFVKQETNNVGEEIEGEVDEEEISEGGMGEVIEGRFKNDDFRVVLMQRGWHADPTKRPKFREIVNIYKQNT